MIAAEQINAVVERIVSSVHPEKIILFGSYANGQPTKDSDLDLLIIKESEIPKIERNRRVRRLLKEFYFPVDIFIKSPQEYDRYKDVVGTVVYSADKYGK